MVTPPAKEVEKVDKGPIYDVAEGQEEGEREANNDRDEEKGSSEDGDSSTESIN